jgi:hypothetical protein
MSDDGAADGLLFEYYRRYLGQPDTRMNVYFGFLLFFAGIALALVTLVLFVYSSQFPGGPRFFVWRRLAYVGAMLSLPVTMLGITVLLPVGRRGVVGGAVGTVGIVVATGVFASVYPQQWNQVGATDYSVPIITGYAVGLAVVLASTGAALVAYHLARAERIPEDLEPVEDEHEESYTDEEIRDDIESAMEGVDISWGGVEKTENTQLQLSGDEFDTENAFLDVEADRVTRSGVDDQVSGLKALKGGEKKTDRSVTTVDDQTTKLKELREQKQKQDAESAPDTLLERLLAEVRKLT